MELGSYFSVVNGYEKAKHSTSKPFKISRTIPDKIYFKTHTTSKNSSRKGIEFLNQTSMESQWTGEIRSLRKRNKIFQIAKNHRDNQVRNYDMPLQQVWLLSSSQERSHDHSKCKCHSRSQADSCCACQVRFVSRGLHLQLPSVSLLQHF